MKKDICLNCGKEHDSKLFGAKCDCDKPNVVHQIKCDGCDNIIGVIGEDDYCGDDKLYCHECLNKARKISDSFICHINKGCLTPDKFPNCGTCLYLIKKDR